MTYQHPQLGVILGWKFQHAEGISTYDGRLSKWPTRLGPRPTETQLQAWVAEWEALPREEQDPKEKLRRAVASATTIAQLKPILQKLLE